MSALDQPGAASHRIGFCGLGRMGLPMVHRLVDAGHRVAIWNRSPDKSALVEQVAPSATIVCRTPAEVAASSEAVMLCLTDGTAVETVAFGDDGLAHGARPNLNIVDHSTIAPSTTRQLATRWRECTGGNWIDAPVSGGTTGAAQGTLAVMAGGDAAAILSLRAVVSAYAARVTRMGDSGAGQATKLANQAIVMTTIAGLAEATRLARRAGIDGARIPFALKGGWADSVLLQTLMPRMIDAPSEASGTIRTMLKDLDAVNALAHEHEVTLPVAALVRELLVRAIAQGLGDADISQVVRVEID
ncbi:NAD(P)-dependent oxidoreductase [Paraburkholderia antibiotica]|uniref:NAD(P)-dependent oxidoreductase n=1 Tax=Paraburkholderia antibiotica TaxID=2728839 RepID=A0A7X9X285_9BURK|nr:NAD(P)-dependent oxidoreductase [Paraburkholderia antibiotica]NML30001.1 NAD(P)-dependent oxidoreductase [Paraburkholderia antibiotica]